VQVLGGRLVAGAELVGGAVVEVEPEPELLQPAAASTAAATAARPTDPSLGCLRTMVPPGGNQASFMRGGIRSIAFSEGIAETCVKYSPVGKTCTQRPSTALLAIQVTIA
jgi:hypothetical protein